MVSSFALLVAATPGPSANEIMAAHRARTSVTAIDARVAAERERLCAKPSSALNDEVIVCGRRDSDAFRVPTSQVSNDVTGDPAQRYAEASEQIFSSCGIGVNLCGRPAIKVIGIPLGAGASKESKSGLFAKVAGLLDGED